MVPLSSHGVPCEIRVYYLSLLPTRLVVCQAGPEVWCLWSVDVLSSHGVPCEIRVYYLSLLFTRLVVCQAKKYGASVIPWSAL